ncbi:MAG: SagB/ThcOx family dehydrogenase [Methanobacteriaceae archaeon]
MVILVILIGLVVVYLAGPKPTEPVRKTTDIVELPNPAMGTMLVEEAIQNRRSIRSYTDEPLSLEDISQLLWAIQGITDPDRGFRAVPSAGRTYPLEVYLVVGTDGVKNLSEGVYHYDPLKHRLGKFLEGDVRSSLADAAHGQPWVAEAPVNIVITAVYNRTTDKYGDLGVRFVHMEAGHAGQNLFLQAVARGLGTVSVGSFYDEQVEKLLQLPADEKTLYIFPVGHPMS